MFIVQSIPNSPSTIEEGEEERKNENKQTNESNANPFTPSLALAFNITSNASIIHHQAAKQQETCDGCKTKLVLLFLLELD
mmetsp:Transcript_51201/g.123607  ORF Transcript_51201/g.123607 Transcript_51201/m.123607 type:complete len:81 (+) Transcript_51201:185-427(+)